MNYKKIHDQLIERAKVRNLTNRKITYFETHHIVPKCLGGSNNKENLVNLTAREHFLIHWLLHRIYPESTGLARAFYRSAHISSKNRNFIPSSSAYEEARIALYLAAKKYKATEEIKAKISLKIKGKKRGQRSAEVIEKIRIGNKGKKRLQITRDKISLKRRLQIITKQHKSNISIGLKRFYSKNKVWNKGLTNTHYKKKLHG